MILNNVRQHSCFVIQGSYIGCMFRLIDQPSSGLLSRLSDKVLCTRWDPSVCTSVKYIKSDQLPNEVWCTYCVTVWSLVNKPHSSKQQLDGNGTRFLADKRQILFFFLIFKHFNLLVTHYVHHTSLGNWSDFMYFTDVYTLGSQCVHSTLWLNLLNRPEDDWSISRNM